jgi:DNA polymerase III subunit chi
MSKAKAEISIYQLTTHPVDKVLPKILEKVYDTGMRALVVTDTVEHMQALNTILWTYSPGAFLPHGMDGNKTFDPAENPIWITTDIENKNEANVLVLTFGRKVDDLSSYVRCVDMFDGNDLIALTSAQQRCNDYQKQGHPIIYWKQTLNGNWDQVPITDVP